MGFNSLWQNHREELDAKEKALDKVKRIEKKRLDKGWRWVSVNGITKVLVPFKEDGTPTEQGLEIIRRQKEKLGINKV